ncbi:hypothetical protein [Variovorax sp. dw_308]|uniref:hypothetical protein n=2 Tax=unclassified Variovorax TaxID=663243 RepID=UPI001C46A2E5|nr:hypothetical protein [Variovorax sp. dw_308]
MNALTARMPLSMARPALSRTGRLFIGVLLIVVFEGAVRKWGTSAATLPMILLRDAMAGYLIFHAWRSGHLRTYKNQTAVLLAWTCCVIAWGMLQVIVNDGNPIVFLIGLRFWLLYIWFGFAAASSMTEADFRIAMRTATVLLILLAPLVILQYASPPGARINTEVDSVDDQVFIVIAGVVRTTGTFSFTAGFSTFLGLVIPIALTVVAARKRTLTHAFIAVAAFGAVVAESLVSGARSAVIYSGLMIAIYLLGRLVFSKPADKGRALMTLLLALGALAILAIVFQTAIENTQQRFDEAAQVENFWDRVLVYFAGEPTVVDFLSWTGVGIGQLSNLAGYVSTGVAGFSLAEAEGGRVLIEGGLLGGLYTAMKLIVMALGLYRSFVIAVRRKIIFPLLLWISLSVALLSWAAIGQLTANALLGFALAFALAALRYPTLEIFPSRITASRRIR